MDLADLPPLLLSVGRAADCSTSGASLCTADFAAATARAGFASLIALSG